MRRLIAAATALAALAAAAPAGARDWSPPILLEPTPPGFDVPEGPVSVAANVRGDAIAVWVRQRASDQGTTCCDDERVIASYRPAGGAFGKPETISRLGDEATAPAVAVDPAGNAFVAWVVNDVGAALEITPGGVGVAARRAGERRFDRPRLMSRVPGSDVHVTAGVDGGAVVAWESLSRRTSHDLLWPRQVMAAVQSGPGRFARPVAVSGPTAATDLGGVRLPLEMHVRAAADRSGATYLAWSRDDGSAAKCCRALEVSRRRVGRAFEPPSVASGPFPAEREDEPLPFLASRPAGAVLAWMDGDTMVSREWPEGQPLGPIARLDLPRSGDLQALGIAGDGKATALIGLVPANNDDRLGFTLSATRRPPGGAFGPLEEFARSGSEASLLVDRTGSAHAIWTRYTKLSCYRSDCSPAGPRIDAADAPARGGFANVRTIASRDNGARPSIAAAGSGAAAGWLGDHGPWVSALGPRIGRPPVRHAMHGPRVRRFAKHGRRTFTFRLSKPARVVIDITRVEGGDEVRRIGQATVHAGRGAGRVTLPRRIRPLRGRSYAATLIAEDATGHDSVSIAPVFFRGG